jgi:putative toxin-antitoxin system antitoxin component (TIGR02293 family)
MQKRKAERLVRLLYIWRVTLELFEGDAATARAWLGRPQRGLGGRVPLGLLRTELGARQVEDLIGRLEHGVFT